MDHLHVDLDADIPDGCPNVPEFIEDYKHGCVDRLREFDPPPSYIVDSGGGVQAFWKLEKPVFVNEHNVDDVELYNRQLSITFGGDKCHNIDRIMRVPFTNNIPNQKKLDAGRVKCQTKLIESNGQEHSIDKFIKAPVTGKANVIHNVEISGNLPQMEAHEVKLSDKYLEIILMGNCVEDPYASRSEALMALVCAMLRVGHTDDEVASVCMNRGHRVSDSIYEKPRPIEYMEKQISKGKEFNIDPNLVELNEEFCVVRDSGKTVVFNETYDYDLHRKTIERIDFTNFRNFYCNRFVEVGDNHIPMGQWWLAHPNRRTYDGVVFSPNREIEGYYNMWAGFTVEPIPNEWNLLKEHILNVICGGNEIYYEYLMDWMARCVQHPELAAEVAVVLRGQKGTGKSIFINSFGYIFGQHFLQITNQKHLVGNFNAHLENVCLLFADEGFWAGDKQGESVLKGLITEERQMIERKGVDSKAKRNHLSLMIASNNDWVVPASEGERRYFVLDVTNDKMQNIKYFHEIKTQMNNGGYEGMLYELRKRDIGNFNFREVPQTEGLQDQKILSMDSNMKWWYERLQSGSILNENDKWTDPQSFNMIMNEYSSVTGKRGIAHKAGETEMRNFFEKILPKDSEVVKKRRVHPELGRCIHWEFPPLKDCQEAFATILGVDIEWDVVTDVEEMVI